MKFRYFLYVGLVAAVGRLLMRKDMPVAAIVAVLAIGAACFAIDAIVQRSQKRKAT